MGLDIISSTLVFIFIIGGLTFKFRKNISQLFIKYKSKRLFIFLFSGMFFAVVEENINCPPTGCTLFPATLIVFFIMLLVYYILLRLFKIKNYYFGLFLFGFLGWISEFILGAHTEILWSNPLITFVFSIWTTLTYAIIVIISTEIYYLLGK